MAIRVLLADDHTMFRQGIATILQGQPEIEVVAQAPNGAIAVEMAGELHPDVVVMDVHMPEMDGVRATRAIMQQDNPPAIIILTMSRQDDYVFEAIKAGARGYYIKDADTKDLVRAIEMAAAGEMILEPSLAQRVLREFRQLATGGDTRMGLSSLDDREVAILRRVAAGDTNREIGNRMGLSEKTIKNQLSSIFDKLKLNNRTQAAIYALQHGLLTLEELDM